MALSVTITNTSDTEREITAELPADEFDAFRTKAIAHLSATVHIDGFRTGHIPSAIILGRLGEAHIREEMANDALEKLYPEILRTHKLTVIDRPEIRVTKLAAGNPLEFKVRVTILPDFDLPDYRTIAKQIARPSDAENEVSDADVDRMISYMRKGAWMEEKSPEEQKEEPADTELPAFDNAFIARFGSFSSLDDFRDTLKTNMKREREIRAKDKRTNELLDALAGATDLSVPKVLTDHQADHMVRELAIEIERLGVPFADYLDHAKITEEDLRMDHRSGAEKRAKLNLVLNRVAEAEHIGVPDDESSAFIEQLTKAHPDIPSDSIRNYAEEILLRRHTVAFLENL